VAGGLSLVGGVNNNFYMANVEGVWAAGEVNDDVVVSEQSRIITESQDVRG